MSPDEWRGLGVTRTSRDYQPDKSILLGLLCCSESRSDKCARQCNDPIVYIPAPSLAMSLIHVLSLVCVSDYLNDNS
jgi:hypothetical protein